MTMASKDDRRNDDVKTDSLQRIANALEDIATILSLIYETLPHEEKT